MMFTFKPGEAVVCVSTVCPECGESTGSDIEMTAPQPELRKVYRVGPVGLGMCNICGAKMACFLPDEYSRDVEWSWPQECFKRIKPATKDIFALADRPLEVV